MKQLSCTKGFQFINLLNTTKSQVQLLVTLQTTKSQVQLSVTLQKPLKLIASKNNPLNSFDSRT